MNTRTHLDTGADSALLDERPTMEAIVQHRYGTTDTLRHTTVLAPPIGDHEALIAVGAAAVDRATVHLMTGRPHVLRAAFGLRRPKTPIPGCSAAGTVIQVGGRVTRFAVGDRVFGTSRGAFAQYATAHEDKLAQVPDVLDDASAAAVPDSGLTALRAVDVAQIEVGRSVLIIGASGGVGSFATQIASLLGAEVTGVCSTAKVEFVRSLGAARVIDYQRDALDADGERYDAVIDIGGNTSLHRLRRVLKRDGRLVIVGGEGGGKWFGGTDRQLRALALSPFVSQRLTTFVVSEHHGGLDTLVPWLENGSLVPAVTKRYALADAGVAIDDLVAGRIAGKAVVMVACAETSAS